MPNKVRSPERMPNIMGIQGLKSNLVSLDKIDFLENSLFLDTKLVEIFLFLYNNKDMDYTVSEINKQVKFQRTTVWKKLSLLYKFRIVSRRPVGASALYKIDLKNEKTQKVLKIYKLLIKPVYRRRKKNG